MNSLKDSISNLDMMTYYLNQRGCIEHLLPKDRYSLYRFLLFPITDAYELFK